jgi:hypothetical protein
MCVCMYVCIYTHFVYIHTYILYMYADPCAMWSKA